MRSSFILFLLTVILFHAQAQTKDPAQLLGHSGDRSAGTLESVEDKVVEEDVPDSMRVYTFAQVMPSFPGGDSAFYSFVNKNLIYPEDARQRKMTGVVFVDFIVERNGSLSTIHVLRGLDPSCDKAALDVISKSPKWIPGLQDGKAVRVKCVRRVKFTL